MLCPNCAGTRYSVFSDEIKVNLKDGCGDEHCANCGSVTSQPCPECLGLGYRLMRAGYCDHCGSTMTRWQPCRSCETSGHIHLLHTCGQPALLQRPLSSSVHNASVQP